MPTVSTEIQTIIDCVEQWINERGPLSAAFSQDGLRKFCETNNYRSRTLIKTIGRGYPDFWAALAELATNAATLTAKAKLIVDHRDLTGV
jgi:hypothetical protein